MNKLTFVAIACVLTAVLVQHAESCCDKDCPMTINVVVKAIQVNAKTKVNSARSSNPTARTSFSANVFAPTTPEPTTTTTPEPTTTTTPEPTTTSTTEASTTTSTTTEASTTTTEEPTTTRFEALAMAVQLTTTEEPEPTGSTVDPFKDDGKVKCMSCKKRRKELKTLYNKYYPKDQQDQEEWDEASTTPQPTHATKKK
uniref:Uncharacterized protein n=1 Tax=Ditylenchus dipsaci TaxID=166011 RepID=A0A915EQ82_9BILA